MSAARRLGRAVAKPHPQGAPFTVGTITDVAVDGTLTVDVGTGALDDLSYLDGGWTPVVGLLVLVAYVGEGDPLVMGPIGP